jgi:hypothetical protein
VAYIGNQIPTGSYRKLSDISSGFNGSTTTFQLSVPPGTAQFYVTPTSVYQLLISIGGIIQNPGTDYTLSGSQIVFTTAPTAGLSFFGIQMGDALNVGTPSDGTVTASKLSTAGVLPGQAFVVNSIGTAWTLGYAGASGGGSDRIFYENGQTITTNYTITTNNNAVTAGPVTINSGVTVTVPSGSYWTIV